MVASKIGFWSRITGRGRFSVMAGLGQCRFGLAVLALSLLAGVEVQAVVPTFAQAIWQDADQDGNIDRVRITFSGPVKITDTNSIDGLPCIRISYDGSEVAQLGKVFGTHGLDDDTDPDYPDFVSIDLLDGAIPQTSVDDLEIGYRVVANSQIVSADDDEDQMLVTDEIVGGVDAADPVPLQVSTSESVGTYGVGSVLRLQVQYSESVTVTGSPSFSLNSSGAATAAYESGSASNTLVFTHVVQAGDSSTALDVAAAATVQNGTILDSASNSAVADLPDPGSTALSAVGLAVDTNNVTNPFAIVARITMDTNLDGYIDAVEIVLNHGLNDAGVDIDDFTLTDEGGNAIAPLSFLTITGASLTEVDDQKFLIQFTDAQYDTGELPSVAFAGATFVDGDGNILAASAASPATDGAAPVLLSFDEIDLSKSTPSMTFTFSEALDTSTFEMTEVTITDNAADSYTLKIVADDEEAIQPNPQFTGSNGLTNNVVTIQLGPTNSNKVSGIAESRSTTYVSMTALTAQDATGNGVVHRNYASSEQVVTFKTTLPDGARLIANTSANSSIYEDANGIIHAVYVNGGKLYYRRTVSANDGTIWSSPVVVVDYFESLGATQIYASSDTDGVVHIVFQGVLNAAGSQRLYYINRVDEGAWSAAVPVSDDLEDAGPACLTVEAEADLRDDTLHLVWATGTEVKYAALSGNGANTWTAGAVEDVSALGVATASGANPKAVVDSDGAVHVVYLADLATDGNRQIATARRSSGGVWVADIQVASVSTTVDISPAIAISGGKEIAVADNGVKVTPTAKLHVVWADNVASGYLFAKSWVLDYDLAADGDSILSGSASVLDWDVAASYTPQLLASGDEVNLRAVSDKYGNAHLVYQNDTHDEIYYRVYNARFDHFSLAPNSVASAPVVGWSRRFMELAESGATLDSLLVGTYANIRLSFVSNSTVYLLDSPPHVLGAEEFDMDRNGSMDALVLTMTEDMNDASISLLSN
jgi:hypothetical protein